jgi:hypothetical protein
VQLAVNDPMPRLLHVLYMCFYVSIIDILICFSLNFVYAGAYLLFGRCFVCGQLNCGQQ